MPQNPPKKTLPDDLRLCKPADYAFFVAERNFTFPNPSEVLPNGSILYEQFVAERNFIFPELLCNPAPNELVLLDIEQGNTILSHSSFYQADFSIDFHQGNVLEIKFTEDVPPIEIHQSQELTVDLVIPKEVDVIDIQQGATLTFDESLIGHINIHQGQSVEWYSPAEFGAEIHQGQTLTLNSLEVRKDFIVDIHQGQTLKPVLGEITDFQIPIQQGQTLVWDEQVLSDLELGTGYFVHDVELRHSSNGLSFGQIDIHQGQTLEHLNALFEATPPSIFQPEIIGNNPNTVYVALEGQNNLFIWMEEQCCNRPFNDIGWNNIYWEYNKDYDTDINSEHYAINGMQLQPLDLATMVNLEATCYTGQSLEYSESLDYVLGYMYLADGMTLNVSFDESGIIKTCPSNEILDGDDLSIDMIDPYTYDCDANYIYQGQELKVDLEISPNLQGQFYYSNSFEIDLEVIPWEARIWYGNNVQVALSTTEKLDAEISQGNILEVQIYEEPIECFYGNEVHIEMMTEYDVSFVDEGCLENEYIYVDENGVRLDYLTIKDTVELMPYRHWIKAKCY